MDYSNSDIKKEALRWDEIVGGNDNYISNETLGIKDVLNAHFLIADFFRDEGKELTTIGPKSMELLHSALYRPFVGFGGNYKWTDTFDVAATLLYGLLMNHPFHDSNKRTAFLSTLYLLQKRGYVPTVDKKVFEDFLVSIVDHKIEKSKRYQEYVKKYDDPEIKYISFWLRKSTRRVRRERRTITYRDLLRILNGFDFDLQNPYRNHIDVMQKKQTRGLLGLGKERETWQRIGVLGFPGMTKQVQRGDLKKVREMTGLTEKNGYDNAVFYGGADPLSLLIAEYQEPLRRLADR